MLDENGRILTESVAAREADAEFAGASEGPDERALRDLSQTGGGVYAPAAAATLRSGGPRATELIPTWPFLLVLATLLVGLDVWMRRLARGKQKALELLAAPGERPADERSNKPIVEPVPSPATQEQPAVAG